MTKARPALASVVFTLGLSAVSLPALASERINLVFDGVPTANLRAAPATAAFTQWCAGVCFPTTQFPVHEASTGHARGHAAVWGKDFESGSGGSLCFSEFIAFVLQDGEVHVRSGTRGTCGAPIDPSLKPPKYAHLGAQVVIAGGGDGDVVGGSGRYASSAGRFTDRVFVGFGPPSAGVGGIVYYDQLWFSIEWR